jgi:hypothetical protein
MDAFASEADLDDWLDEESPYDELYDADDELYDGDDVLADLGDAFRRLLHEDYDDLTPEETDEVLVDMVESLPPDEAFNFVKALGDIAKPAGGVLRSPQFGQILTVAAPLAGTALGGPAGGAVAGSLAQAAGSALARSPKVPAVPAAAMPAMVAAAGPPGAAQAGTQVLAQLPPATQVAQAANAVKAFNFASLPAVREAVLANAMKPFGQQSVAGIPVNQLVGTLATLLAGSVPGEVPGTVPTTVPGAVTEAIDDSDDVPVELFGDEAWAVDEETADEIYETLVARHQQDLADDAAGGYGASGHDAGAAG